MPRLGEIGQLINHGVCNVFNTVFMEVGEAIGNVRRGPSRADRRSDSTKSLDQAYRRRLAASSISLPVRPGEYGFAAGRGEKAVPEDNVVEANYRVIEPESQEEP